MRCPIASAFITSPGTRPPRPRTSSRAFVMPDGGFPKRPAGEGGRGSLFSNATGGEVATVSVILDGENAWEYYDGGGRPFLRALYRALSEADDIQTVTMSE